jgi:predicted metal-binding protein
MPDTPSCPYCTHDQARRVAFTPWGGWVGARVMSIVECGRCARQYNGRNGRKIEKAIRVYRWATLVVLAFVAAIAIYFYSGGHPSRLPGKTRPVVRNLV